MTTQKTATQLMVMMLISRKLPLPFPIRRNCATFNRQDQLLITSGASVGVICRVRRSSLFASDVSITQFTLHRWSASRG